MKILIFILLLSVTCCTTNNKIYRPTMTTKTTIAKPEIFK